MNVKQGRRQRNKGNACQLMRAVFLHPALTFVLAAFQGTMLRDVQYISLNEGETAIRPVATTSVGTPTAIFPMSRVPLNFFAFLYQYTAEPILYDDFSFQTAIWATQTVFQCESRPRTLQDLVHTL